MTLPDTIKHDDTIKIASAFGILAKTLLELNVLNKTTNGDTNLYE